VRGKDAAAAPTSAGRLCRAVRSEVALE